MAERNRNAEQLPPGSILIPTTGIGFTQPWREIVKPLNVQLRQQRYPAFDPNAYMTCVIGDLKPARPTKETFDPVRVYFDPSSEGYSAEEQALADLGLQASYWTDMAVALDPLISRKELRYEDWKQFSSVPVFKEGKKFHLMARPGVNNPATINYAGDGDMISDASRRIRKTRAGDVPFTSLGIHNDLLVDYVKLRERISAAENQAAIEARQALRADTPTWERLRAQYPGIDDVFDRSSGTTVIYQEEAKQLIDQQFGVTSKTPLPTQWIPYIEV